MVEAQRGYKKCQLDSMWAHQGDLEEAIASLQVVLLDSCEQEKDLKRQEDKWMCNLGTLFVGLNSHNEVLSNRRRNFGLA